MYVRPIVHQKPCFEPLASIAVSFYDPWTITMATANLSIAASVFMVSISLPTVLLDGAGTLATGTTDRRVVCEVRLEIK